MNKKIIFLIIILVIIAIGIFWIVKEQNKKELKNNSNLNSEKEIDEDRSKSDMKQSLVIYFSATGTTKELANKIAKTTKSDITEIIPKNKYSSSDLDYNNDHARANQEQNDESSRPEIKNTIKVDEYDTIYIGYPIWWGDVPKIILTFLDTYHLDGKTVIPFCTSGGTGISQSQNTLESYRKNINWKKGEKFSSTVSEQELSSWINKLDL